MAVVTSQSTSNIDESHFTPISRRNSGLIYNSGIPIQRTFTKTYNGSIYPNSSNSCQVRTSLRKLCQEKRAHKIHVFINGDRFFKGIPFAVSSERFKSFETLLEELTRLLSDYQANLPKGVRIIFDLDGDKITSVNELVEGQKYVCASSEPFKNIGYAQSKTKSWHLNRKHNGMSPLFSSASTSSIRSLDSSCYNSPSHSFKDITSPSTRDFIRPRLIIVFRNGVRPRKATRIILNKKTVHSYNQVLSYITDSIKLDTGAVRKIFSLDGQQVTCLEDFFKEAEVFIAYGSERHSVEDFCLNQEESKSVNIHGTPIASRKEQFYTGLSPAVVRRVTSEKNHANKIKRMSLRDSPRKCIETRPMSLFQNENDEVKFEMLYPQEVKRRYIIGNVIGCGNFAVVNHCKDLKTKQEYAMKIIDNKKSEDQGHVPLNEVDMMRKIKHENIVSFIWEYNTTKKLYVVMELAKGGDLCDKLAEETKFSETITHQLVSDLMKAVSYLHAMNIVHRDIKPENLLVTSHSEGCISLKLADFGLATSVTGTLKFVCGTPTYIAPEIITMCGYGLPVDIWAVGVLMYLFLSGFPPFYTGNDDQFELFDKILSLEYKFHPDDWNHISPATKELISSMLTIEVQKRPSASEVLNHKWLSAKTHSYKGFQRGKRSMHNLSKSPSFPSNNQSFIPVRKYSYR